MKRAIALVLLLLAAWTWLVACDALPAEAPTPEPTATLLPTIVPSITAPPPTVPPSPTTAPIRTSTLAAPAALAICPILATRTPPPGAPTYIPGGPNPPRGPVDPHIELCGNASTVQIGKTLTLTAKPVDIGLPYFMLTVRDGEPARDTQIVQVTYENRKQGPTRTSALFELVSAKAGMYEATFVLRALHAGTAMVTVSATGEIHFGYPGPATYAGGSSGPAVVKVVGK